MSTAPPDRWLVLRIPLPPDGDLRDLMVEELMELEVRGVEEREDALVVYLPPPSGPEDAFAHAVGGRLAEVSGMPSVPVETAWQPHEAWSDHWRSHFKPREITSRIIVAPSWESPAVGPGQVLVTLDPGMAFGTSDHPTTRGCLRMLDRLVEPGDRISDIGSGSGILAITAALLGAREVLAIELDPWACAAARENASINSVADRVEVRAAPITPEGLPGEAPFSGIVANIESGILTPLLPGLRSAMEEGGWLILSGILRIESDALVDVAREARLELREVDEEGEWWTGEFSARR